MEKGCGKGSDRRQEPRYERMSGLNRFISLDL